MASSALTPFGVYLTELLAARGMTLRAFAAAVRVDHTAVLYAKRARIATKRIRPWADALSLKGAERERFEFLAWCTHAPPILLRRLHELEKRVEELTQQR